MNTACAEELNQLLKGTHMGASLFEDLKANVRDDQLRRLIDDCLKRLRKHEELLTHHVELMQEEPSEDSGFFGTLSELGAMVRQAMLDECELVNECMKYMESAIKALNQFEQKQLIMEPMVQRSLYYMRDDYMIIYHAFHQYALLHAD